MDFKMQIDRDAKAAWIAALDSGQFPQAKGKLQAQPEAGGGYCCLGVFAKVQGCQFSFAEIDETDEEGHATIVIADDVTIRSDTFSGDINTNETLDQDFASRFGISDAHQNLLTHLNDGGEMKLLQSEPMFEVAGKLCASQRTPDLTEGAVIFKFNPHTFTEISQIIKDNF